MDAGTILILGAVLLGFGSACLFLVSSINQGLKGLGWLAGAFASGAGGAGLLIAPAMPQAMHSLVPDLLVFLPFVLFQVAVSELLGDPLLPRLGIWLLSAIAALDALYIGHAVHGMTRVSAISLAVAVQCFATARQLQRNRRERKAVMFCATMLFGFSGFNAIQSMLFASGLFRHWRIGHQLLAVSGTLYIAVGLGLAFSFFWMTNAWLSTHLEEMAATDPLTRIFNRRTFMRACEKEMRASLRRNRPFSILMADLDHFKNINDRFGHEVGDAVLIAVVEQMQHSIRGVDVLGRWGGEEFVVLLPHANEEAAWMVAERVRSSVARTKWPFAHLRDFGGEVPQITVSIGAATFDRVEDLASLLRRADEYLYAAKDRGRNRVLQCA